MPFAPFPSRSALYLTSHREAFLQGHSAEASDKHQTNLPKTELKPDPLCSSRGH